ncbi:MAG: response regulator [Azospirillaceae bacterium]|nr:response regulator [Azospirillaceae bacterium]
MPLVDYGKIRVLLVEDEAFTRAIIHKILRDIGVVHIGLKDNGKDALLEVVRTRPDIVFCDVHMEQMDGRQFLQGVRAIKVRGANATPIVFLTADAHAETVNFARENGVNGYLVKPVSLKQVKDRIDVIVAKTPQQFAHAIVPAS